MRRFLTAAALVALGAATAAQSTTITDKSLLPGVPLASWWPAELDGQRETREWLGYRMSQNHLLYATLVERQGRYCAGPWFNPWDRIVAALPGEFLIGGEADVRGVRKFVAQNVRYYIEVSFDLPRC